ncbi:iron complex outermembrane recepter protein (plasmid) [Fibrisoma limi BUZ 3]|uniref:Iron complex outermembrane recepter protein n=1 Tax=Fibrisoma limi BUZ 3 TaxID=1185876 RepID=I2GU47_9BACT|nr:iron complex outermembrane receptor protein [Fibrisoma limi]CCH57648.1 iron complex outermembrane recepter protein [Fibrisoma limi BUZ 3]
MNGYFLKGGINNLTDERYFTRRAGCYSGPGILPTDARYFYVTAGIKL